MNRVELSVSRVLPTLGVLLALGAPAVSQVGGTQNPAGSQAAGAQQGPGGQGSGTGVPVRVPGPGAVDPNERPMSTGDAELDNLIPVWQQAPTRQAFRGFPIFPNEFPGYGGYPRSLSEIATSGEIPALRNLPVPAAPPQTGWPVWLENLSSEPLPYQPDRALLLRTVGRVWLQTQADPVFTPLYFHDKLRNVAPQTAVEVRQVGEFELLLYGGSRFVSHGPARLHVRELTDEHVVIDLRELTNVRFEGYGREHRVHLPDGSTLVVSPGERPIPSDAPVPPPPTLGGFGGLGALLGAAGAGLGGAPTGPQPALLVLERADEPGRHSGRATIWNGGAEPVEWRHAFGTTQIGSGERVTFFLAPPATGLPGGLSAAGVDVARDGTARRCQSPAGGAVTWSGAQFDLAGGAVLRLDPLQGDPFATKRTDPPAASEPEGTR